jgi:hypothetical protein
MIGASGLLRDWQMRSQSAVPVASRLWTRALSQAEPLGLRQADSRTFARPPPWIVRGENAIRRPFDCTEKLQHS